ncbi:MarR family winged helix-turn-helix transcriptional regulator [Aquipuribacter sp. MA13-6]|uniref:MarR family winged helix-turn-helix transcriptional regulator n=1 Tax=unclassified Aquipuribacter TaxID=2635084 RepID=UPI003EEAF96A
MTSPASPDPGLRPVERVEAEVGVLLRRARRFSAQIARDVHPDVEPGAYGILVRLASTGGERLTDVAAAFGVGKPTVSRQVAVLERLRLLDRSPDPLDARAQVLRLTPEGAERLDRARTARRGRFRELLRQWPEDDVTALADLLHRFNDLDDPEG